MTLDLISLGVIFYMLGLAYLSYHWTKGLDNYTKSPPSTASFSILIPYRNESSSLIDLIESILPQLEASDEIILIDDHSENGLNQKLMELYQTNSSVTLLCLDGGESGKKAGLKKGFLHAKADRIIQIDADIEVGPNWLSAIKQIPENVQLGILPVALHGINHGLKRLEQTEFMSLAGVTGAMAARNQAAMANGASLLVSRGLMQSYVESSSDKQISSGDDMFILGLAKKQKLNIQYCFDSRCIVHAKGNESLQEYFDQRIRWASKMRAGKNLPGTGLGAIVILFQLFFIVAICYLIYIENWHFAFILFGAKGFAEFLFSRRIARFFGYSEWLDNFSIFGTILYPFTSLFTAIASIFYRPKWKGRIIDVK